MDKSSLPEWLTAAECASRTGLTVRALRLYEEYGLITPRRSAGGWRQYGPEDLVKLNTVAMLKTTGLSLAQIREVTRSSPRAPTLQQILEIQLGSWNSRLEDAERGRAITKAALERLRTDHSLSVDEICNVIRSFEMSQTPSTLTAADKEFEEVILEPAVLDRYVGFYAPHNGEFGNYTITRDAQKLVMQITGQPPFDLYPVGETEFAVRLQMCRLRFCARRTVTQQDSCCDRWELKSRLCESIPPPRSSRARSSQRGLRTRRPLPAAKRRYVAL